MHTMQAAQEQPVIAIAGKHDIPALSDIWLELMSLHQDRDPRFALSRDGQKRWCSMAGEMIAREDALLIKAELQGLMVGFCLGWIAQNPPIYHITRVGFISEIAVIRSHRRRGIGGVLMQEARRWFRERGLDELQLSTAVWNEDARRFWESVGGEPVLIRYRFPT